MAPQTMARHSGPNMDPDLGPDRNVPLMSDIRRPQQSLLSRTSWAVKRALKQAEARVLAPAVIASGPHPIRLIAVPKDRWDGDTEIGAGILAGRFVKAGQVLKGSETGTVVTDRWTPEALWRAPHSDGWRHWLHGFSWLRDLATVTDRTAARRLAEAHIKAWAGHFDRWPSPAWEPALIGRRVLSWMTCAPLILASNDHVYRSRVLNSLARQARFLSLGVKTMEPGRDRITALVALTASGLLLPQGEARSRQGLSLLALDLHHVVLGDGGFITRSPADLLAVFQDLLLLEAVYAALNEQPAEAVTRALDRIAPALKAVLHGDGRLAQFNGSDSMQGLPQAGLGEPYGAMAAHDNGVYSGFHRLHRGPMSIIVDAGPPPRGADSRDHHAGTASFEMSLERERVVVNCGSTRALPDPDGLAATLGLGTGGDLNKTTRATAAHSTLIINDTHSSQLLSNGQLGDGPTLVQTERQDGDDGALLVDVSHDGYGRRYGLTHRRRFFLSADGVDFRGEDTLEALETGRRRTLPYDLRFHLHPDITARFLGADEGVQLRLSSGRLVRFIAVGGKITLEDSLYFGIPAMPRPAKQIVLSGRMSGDTHSIRWAFQTV